MLEFSAHHENGRTTISLSGRLNTNTASQLEKELASTFERTYDVTVDLTGLEYLSSAGLRVLVQAFKETSANGGSLILAHPNDEVRDVFEITGLSDHLDIR